MNAVEIIRKKRDGLALTHKELKFFIDGAVAKSIPEYQVSALLMSIYFQGMNFEEIKNLTLIMAESGSVLKFHTNKPKVDKHSTGGLGDKVSLVLAPLVACFDIQVPMIAGRGLGHTGGTVDKLESIPGFNTNIESSDFIKLVEQNNVAIIAQNRSLAPADKLLYSLRDVTSTVESIPLMTASILSKKYAEGINGLVMDIKVGSGAFMRSQKEAEKLAKTILAVGKSLGLKVRVLITDMNQPLGNCIGNSIEVLECIEILEGKGPPDLKELTIELAAHMIVIGQKSSSLSAARNMAKKSLNDGSALKQFYKLCQNQGASESFLKNPKQLTVAQTEFNLVASKDGYVSKIQGYDLGRLLIEFGGGRKTIKDKIDPSIGIRLHAKLGDKVKLGQKLMTLYTKTQMTPEIAEKISSCFLFSKVKPSMGPLIKKVLE